MQLTLQNVLLGGLAILAVTRAESGSGSAEAAVEAQDGSVDHMAAAAIFHEGLADSNAMGMSSKRSNDLFPRANCGHEREYCRRKSSFIVHVIIWNAIVLC